MAGTLQRLLGTASVLCLFVSPSVGLAQSGRPWVDPPSETEPQPQAPAPATSQASTAKPGGSSASPATSERTTSDAGKAPSLQVSNGNGDEASITPAPAPRSKASMKGEAKRKTLSASATHKSRNIATASRSSRKEMLATRPYMENTSSNIEAFQANGRRNGRFESIQRGIDSGLEVMRLRTIQFPDGRRITVLTKPDSTSLSEFLEEPY